MRRSPIPKADPPPRGGERKHAVAPKRAVQWSEIERAVLMRIARKEYAAGEKIPTCEALAAELGANKNTVSKAYRSLAQRGYLMMRTGRGTFVSARSVRLDAQGSLEHISGLVSLAIQEAKLSGVGPAQFQEIVDELTERSWGRVGPRLGFVECNAYDAATLSSELQLALAHPVEPLLLDDVVRKPEQFLSDFDLLAVNLTHLAELEAAVRSGCGEAAIARVLGMHVPIDPESLLQVARLRAGTRLGVICDVRQTLLSLTAMVRSCNPGLNVDSSLADEAASVDNLLSWSDVLLITHSALEHVRVDQSQVPVMTPAFRADPRSIEQLSMLLIAQPLGGKNSREANPRLHAADLS